MKLYSKKEYDKLSHRRRMTINNHKRDCSPIYGIALCERALELIETATTNIQVDLVYFSLPYYLLEMGDFYLPLHREYKPLGLPEYTDFLDYNDYKFLYIPKEKVNTEKLLPGRNGHYFWDDLTSPRRGRGERLAYIDKLIHAFGIE